MSKIYLKRAEAWLKSAQDDLLWGRDSFVNGWNSRACFISQQAVEKALKAYLFFKYEDLLRTHDLPQLLERCEKYDKNFISLFDNCNILDDYYTETRYPNINNKLDDKKIADEALKLAREVVAFVARQIKN